MKSKNIVFTERNVAKLIEEDVREVGDSEVLVKLCVSSVSSGTERANLTGSTSVSIAVEEQKVACFPRRGGYSSAGIIQKTGKNVTTVKVGDRVAVANSSHSQYIVMSEKNVYPIGNISFSDAALYFISVFSLAAIRKCRLEIGESAVVMGLGVLGMAALQLLRAAGAAPVIAVDPNPQKREKALKSGADYALDPYDENFAQTVKNLTDGGAKVGIEVTGVGAGLNGILDCMARFGRVALLGCTRISDFTIDYYRKVHGPGISLIGAHTSARPDTDSYGGWWTESDDMKALIRLTDLNRINLGSLIDETHSPLEAAQVYARLATEKSFPLVQFNWEDLK